MGCNAVSTRLEFVVASGCDSRARKRLQRSRAEGDGALAYLDRGGPVCWLFRGSVYQMFPGLVHRLCRSSICRFLGGRKSSSEGMSKPWSNVTIKVRPLKRSRRASGNRLRRDQVYQSSLADALSGEAASLLLRVVSRDNLSALTLCRRHEVHIRFERSCSRLSESSNGGND